MIGRAIRRAALDSGVLDAPGEAQAFGPRMLARALGAVGVCAAALVGLWLILPHRAEADAELMVVLALFTAGIGLFLLRGRLDTAPAAVLHGFVALGYVLVAVGIYASSAPASGLSYLFLWVIPFAYLGFALRHAVAHTLAMTACAGAAFAARDLPYDLLIPRLVFLLGTALVVGLLLRALVTRMRSVDERFARSFRDSATAMVMIDLQGRMEDVNDAFCSLVGRPRDHLVGTSMLRLYHPDDLARTLLPGAMAGSRELRLVRPDEQVVRVRLEGGLINAHGERHFFGLVHDLSAEHAAESDRARQLRQQAAVAALGRHALRELELEPLLREVARVLHATLDSDLVSVSRYDGGERRASVVAGIGWREHADLSWQVTPGTLAHAALSHDGAVAYEAIEDAPQGSVSLRSHGARSGLMASVDGPDGPWGFVGAYATSKRAFEPDESEFLASVATIVSSAVERFAAEERMRHLALHDSLTGLPNRELAADRLEVALARRSRHRGSVAVLMVDLDHFKVVNDSLGHAAGDQLLRALAPRLEAALRPEDTVARVGGDEFLIVCDSTDSATTPAIVAERLLAAVREPVALESGKRFVTASVGIAVAESADAQGAALIRDADAALYRAKERGRNRYELFDESLRRRAVRRLQVEAELRRALDGSELRVHYQPVVDLASRTPIGLEALVRWQHPERGLLAPAEFVPLAEETGLIGRLGDQVLAIACRDAAHWQRRFEVPLTLAVNVSGRQLGDAAFGARVADVMEATGLIAGTLRLEITETVLIGEGESAVPALAGLHELGFAVVLDDFGTGYSSLSYLKRFAVDALKVDRVFVADMVADESDRAIVDAVLRMSESLGIAVVAEGVDAEPQVEALLALGCTTAQGHLFSEPLDAAELETYLERTLGTAPARP